MPTSTVTETDLDAFIHQLFTGTDDQPAVPPVSTPARPAPRLDLLLTPEPAGPLPRREPTPTAAPAAARRLFAGARDTDDAAADPQPAAGTVVCQTVAEFFREITQPGE